MSEEQAKSLLKKLDRIESCLMFFAGSLVGVGIVKLVEIVLPLV